MTYRDNRLSFIFPVLAVLALAVAAALFVAASRPALAQSPPASVGSVGVARADGTVTASWTAPAGADKYHVTYSTDNRASWSLAAMDHTSASVTISGADNAKTYIVGVRAGNDGGWSGWVNSPAAGPYTPTQPPAAVSGIDVTRADGTVSASWTAPANADKYHVTYSTDGGASWSLAAMDHTTASITISDADNSKTYIVGVRAGNAGGWSSWVNSPAAGPYTPPQQQQPPSAVGSVGVTRADGTVTASWTAPDGADKYHVTYTNDGGASWALAAMAHTTASITISNADNAKTYIVGVRAGNNHGWSGWVNSPPAPALPSAPTGLTIAANAQSLTLAWSNPSDSSITGYEYAVQQSGNDQGDWTAITGSGASTTSYTATGLTNGTEYTIHLRAVNASGNGAAAQASATPNARGIIVQDSDGNAITALSIPEGGEVSYQVKLTAQPAQDVKVCIGLSVRGNKDSDITFKGEASSVVAIELTFTPDNWNTAQTATLVAAEDDDDVNGARDLGLDARTYYGGRVDLTVTEVDND